MTVQTKKIEHASREHAICSASGADRWMNCIGEPAMREKVPPSPSSPYAEEGTKAHELSDKMLLPLVTSWNAEGRWYPEVAAMMDFMLYDKYPKEMWEHVKGYVQTIVDLVEHYKPKKVFVEKKIYLSKELAMFGLGDCFFAFRDERGKAILSVYDLKYGVGHVVEPSSLQLKYYGCAGQKTYTKTKFDEIWLNIYQPRAEHEDGIHRMHVMTKEEVEERTAAFLTTGAKCLSLVGEPVKKIEPYLVAGHWCHWCPAQAICSAYKAELKKQSLLDFNDDITLPAIPERVDDMGLSIDLERLAKIVANSAAISKFLKSAKQLAMNFIIAGNDIPGFKVVEGKSRRKWNKDGLGEAAIEKEFKKLGIKDPYDKKFRGIGSIETELKQITGVKGKKVGELISHIVTQSTPPLALVELSDKRPSIDNTKLALRDFDDEVIDAMFEEE